MTKQAVQFDAEAPIEDLCRQKSVFSSIALLVIAVLLGAAHALFLNIGQAVIRGSHVAGYCPCACNRRIDVAAQSRGRRLTERALKIESCFSIGIAFALTALLTYITDRDESPYFVLLAIPILQCAYVFGLLTTILTIAAADGLIFFWLSYFFALHPPARVSQYLEGGMLSVIYLQMGLLVWFLVNRLKTNQFRLSATLNDLKATREQLIREEKLAAVGRLASGIAHEIRNPVAMISSSLSTASHPRGIA